MPSNSSTDYSGHCLDFSKTNQFSDIFLDYISQKEELREFYGNLPQLENFEKQIDLKIQKKSFDTKKREILVKALHNQYQNTENPPTEKIDLLKKETTFTVTTGHQLNIYTGTLYFHYKIQTVINACKTLKEKYPKYDFVPVYWMASEDHDLEEIASFNLFGKKYTWQTDQKGAVGRMNTKGLNDLGFKEEKAKELGKFYKEAENKNENLTQATRNIVHSFYQKKGLVIVDGDDKDLKRLFIPIIKNELETQNSYLKIEESSKKLNYLGYKTQVTPREINLFYLEDNLRERIIKNENSQNNENRFEILNTDISFSESEIMELVESNPEKFSPNVALRPVYQETILPNLSYTGGPGELAYWLQLKSMFEYFDVNFPILLPRNFALFIPKVIHQKMNKTNLSFTDIFDSFDTLRINYATQNAENDFLLENERKEIESIFDKVESKSIKTDISLQKSIAGEKHRALKRIEHISKKLRKSEEKKQADSINQIKSIKDNLFPNGSLQERYDNFLNFVINDEDFLIKTQELLNPFDLRFLIMTE
ncbi:bacillithiol biosynthesis cysteine-adding enzyme BshC [Bernardetia litoralis DSM 6794]|uniref:Putative cysteine ligase BshC n=1 Tax=Bernardetia litoralis (strain ATCC 23117 / DSM 6794 / NBRC 15988 / NCIMB 1366 / Fx l1 / Sio-4) TaxID=880071 RepID=I4AJ72_BERLS|nr:bacillithiol biosynthesis cysteine-adding enzyme BshC [Bernardetia litoralis]AFM04007.1 bacillithiol biosynthesis cysteine-adding enzyme BshC [Bernardetia litoralis DSM 6794]